MLLSVPAADSCLWSNGAQNCSILVSSPGTYTVTIYQGQCSASVVVTSAAPPTPTILGNTTICQNQSTTLTATGGTSYIWSNGTTDNTLTVSMSGTYQVIGYNTAGCNAMASATVNVWQPAASEFSVSTPDSCYTWNGIDYCTSGDYIQTLQTVHGCDSVVTLHLTLTVGLDDHHLSGSVTLYPNPANSMLNVQWAMGNEDATIELFDVYGKLLQTMPVAGEITTVNVSGLADGMYFVRVTTDAGAVTKTFVKRS